MWPPFLRRSDLHQIWGEDGWHHHLCSMHLLDFSCVASFRNRSALNSTRVENPNNILHFLSPKNRDGIAKKFWDETELSLKNLKK